MAAEEYYDHTTYPVSGSSLSSAAMRAELSAIEAGFGKLPNLAGNNNKPVRVNPSATGLEATDTLALETLTVTGNTTLGDSASGDSHTINGPTVVNVNSATAALRVTQTGTGDVVRFEDAANPDATPFVIDLDGRVINGHTTTLGSAGNINYQSQIHGTTEGTAGQGIFAWGAVLPALAFTRSNSSTIGTHSAVTSGALLGRLQFAGSDGSIFGRAVLVDAFADGAFTTGSSPGRLTISTTPTGSNTAVERMRIDSEGRVGIGVATLGGTNGQIRLSNNITGSATSLGVRVDGTIQSDVTTTATLFRAVAGTQAASFTLSNLFHYEAFQATLGAGSAVTTQVGFVAASNLTGATNNYGFYGNIPSGTGRWNVYVNGSAANYFAGTVLQGDATERTLSGSIVTSVQIAGTSTGGASAAGVFAGNSVNAPAYVFAKSRGTLASPTAVASGDGLGSLRFDGHTGAAFELAALISAAADGAFSAGTVPARIAISTSGASGTPIERLRIDSFGSAFQEQIAPAAVNATATLTVANLRTRIITSTTAAAVTGTLPTGTLMEGLYNGRTDMGYDWSVINTGGTNNFTVAANTGHTAVGNMVVAPNTSGAFRSRRTATNTWITYRVA
jgi:hypothetical protein